MKACAVDGGLDAVERLAARVGSALLRAESGDAAFVAMCRLAVEAGPFLLAWIGQVDPRTGALRPVARFGSARDVVDRLCAELPAESRAPAWRAVRAGTHECVNDLSHEATDWWGRAEALKYGLQSVASLPFHDANGIASVFELYASEPAWFDAPRLALLEEIVDDLAFALGQVIAERQRVVAVATQAKFLASYSAETGLPNRALLEQRLRVLAERRPRRPVALLVIVLRQLDALSRDFGRPVVDAVLRGVAERLERPCRANGSDWVLAHTAYDEFAVAVPGVEKYEELAAIGRALMGALREDASAPGGAEAWAGACIGAARLPADTDRAELLLAHARTAAANAPPTGEVRGYDPALARDSAARHSLEAELRRAVEQGEFALAYQPQLNLRTGTIVGVEALLRWQHPIRGELLPASFVPALEASGLMPQVGEWVLRQACAQGRAWTAAGLPALRMSVNVSAQQLRDDRLHDAVRDVVRDDASVGCLLDLELTEGLVLDDTQRTIDVMRALKSHGVELSLDDFGTGYSALGYLRRLPIDRIKIDRSFVQDIASDCSSAALVRAILALAASLGMSTLAEGVEQRGQLGYLRKHGCHEMQGFLFSAAVPPDDVAAMLRRDRRLDVNDAAAGLESTILVVDDEPGVQAALKRVMRRDGINVLSAFDANEALELLATRNVGVILCDQRMPGVSGAEFLGIVRGLYPESIRILLTGYTEVTALIDAVNRGAVSKILTKPWEDDQLRANVHEALRHWHATTENRRLHERLERIDPTASRLQ